MAADLDFRTVTNMPFQLVSVTTSAEYLVVLPARHRLTIAPIGKRDASTDSVAGDYVVVMTEHDTMAANLNAGRKMILWSYPGGSGTIRSCHIESGADGPREISMKAVTGAALVQLVCEKVDEV